MASSSRSDDVQVALRRAKAKISTLQQQLSDRADGSGCSNLVSSNLEFTEPLVSKAEETCFSCEAVLSSSQTSAECPLTTSPAAGSLSGELRDSLVDMYPGKLLLGSSLA